MDKTKALRRESDSAGYTRVVLGEPTPMSRTAVIRSLTAGRRVVYAMRVPDGAIKIGTTVDLANRLSALHAELLGFIFGSHEDERALHRLLADHKLRGREYFHPSAAVMDVVNAMRDEFNLPHIAA